MRHRGAKRSIWLFGVGICALTAAGAASAQSVVTGAGFVRIQDESGNLSWLANSEGTSVLGGAGSCGQSLIFNVDHSVTGYIDGCNGDLFLGGGNDDGDITLTDSDGITPTINMNGQLGLLELGSPSDDGDLWIWNHNTDDQRAIDLNGATGTASQQLSGNGFVKAWAKINANGSVNMCYNCSLSPLETRKLGTGQYEISFSPLGPDITSRPRLAVVDNHTSGASSAKWITLAAPDNIPTSVFAYIWFPNGQNVDDSFTIFIF